MKTAKQIIYEIEGAHRDKNEGNIFINSGDWAVLKAQVLTDSFEPQRLIEYLERNHNHSGTIMLTDYWWPKIKAWWLGEAPQPIKPVYQHEGHPYS